jgi:hypothetical protein
LLSDGVTDAVATTPAAADGKNIGISAPTSPSSAWPRAG